MEDASLVNESVHAPSGVGGRFITREEVVVVEKEEE